MWTYNYSNELYHYGVLGMKWGHRRAHPQSARVKYKTAKRQASDEYFKTIEDIERPYKKGQNLSDEDVAREAKAEEIYNKKVAKAKADYKKVSSKQAKEKIAKGTVAAANAMITLGMAKLVDDTFYNGAGQKIAKNVVRDIGRVSISLFHLAKGDRNIRWY